MRRNYDIPPGYGGSRFIRATHGVRGAPDGEFSRRTSGASLPAASRAIAARNDGTRPDFELYGNAVDPYKVADGGEGGERYAPDKAYRGDVSPVDRIGHDFDERRPESAKDRAGENAANGGEAADGVKRRLAPKRGGGRFRPHRPIPPHGAPPHGELPFCPEDGDLLLLALLALFAGEEGNADIVAALALLLMVR